MRLTKRPVFADSPAALRLIFALLLLAIGGAASAEPPVIAYTVVARYAHDANTFTQGLELSGATLFESSGLYGQSCIARRTLPAGDANNSASAQLANQALADKPLADKQATSVALPANYFGEGLTVRGEHVYVLTWREQQGFIFDRHTLRQVGKFHFQGEGWGLTHNGQQLILSNGSALLQFIDPHSFAVTRSLPVSSAGQPVSYLNELEWIDNKALGPPRLLANIWQSDSIVVIDPADGHVTARLDLRQLYPHGQRSAKADVLNGIAVDNRDNTLLITGKYWPYLYRIRLLQPLP